MLLLMVMETLLECVDNEKRYTVSYFVLDDVDGILCGYCGLVLVSDMMMETELLCYNTMLLLIMD